MCCHPISPEAGLGRFCDIGGPLSSLCVAMIPNVISMLVIWPETNSPAPCAVFPLIDGSWKWWLLCYYTCCRSARLRFKHESRVRDGRHFEGGRIRYGAHCANVSIHSLTTPVDMARPEPVGFSSHTAEATQVKQHTDLLNVPCFWAASCLSCRCSASFLAGAFFFFYFLPDPHGSSSRCVFTRAV